MKYLPTPVRIATLALLAAPFANVNAAEPEIVAPAGREPPAVNQEGCGHRDANYAQKSLDELQQQLHLKSNQQTSWTQYKAYVEGALI